MSWRCPHCATPQPEAARCWVCRRSTTTCATCRHFRRGVAAGLGFCGLDRRRAVLAGDEVRPCWEAAPIDLAALRGAPARPVPATGSGLVVTARGFVPVEPGPSATPARTARRRSGGPPGRTAASRTTSRRRGDRDAVTTATPSGPEGRWTLWDD